MADLQNEELAHGESWSTWNQTVEGTSRGPFPRPAWVVDEPGARDIRLGRIKSGKEAALWLVERVAPSGRSCLLGAKEFHPTVSSVLSKGRVANAQGALQGSREKRALKRKSQLGIFLAHSEWALAEFRHLCQFWESGIPVPYPVQILGTQILMEWIGDEDGTACPRLLDAELDALQLNRAFGEVKEALLAMARLGYAHGDLSAYNLLWRKGHVVMIDLPQVVDIAVDLAGVDLLHRDCVNVCKFFRTRGVETPGPDELLAEALSIAWS